MAGARHVGRGAPPPKWTNGWWQVREQDAQTGEGLARFVAAAAGQPLDPQASEVARRGVLDWLGVALAGSREPAGRIIADVHGELVGAAQATLVGLPARTTALQAALVNGTAGHALDLDDTHLSSAVHATATILPAALAVAEAQRSSADDLLRAYATGFEVAAYLGELLYPIHFEAAWHASATFGTLGAAAAAAVLLRLDERASRDALSLAATQAGGLRAMFGTMAKPFHAGKAASTGVLSALLAARGFEAAPEAFRGNHGLFHHLGARRPEDFADVPLPERCERIKGDDFKLHACCHATHAAVDAALAVRRQPGFAPDAIDRVEIHCSPVVPTVAADPDPRSGLAAKFSIAYCVLAALLEGNADRDQFADERFRSSRARTLLPNVTLHLVKDYSVRQAHVEVRSTSGAVTSAVTTAPRGSSQNPAAWEDLAAKFHSLADPVLGAEQAAALEGVVRALPAGSVAEVMRLARTDTAPARSGG